MPRGEIRYKDTKTVFEFQVKDQDGAVVDISTATTHEVTYKKPDGTTVTKECTITDGPNGVMQYLVETDFLDPVGDWRCQGHVVFPSGGTWKSDIRSFRVHENL